ncbi:MAG: hypothetical protein ACRCS9_05325 [Hyphomicrobium sp.]
MEHEQRTSRRYRVDWQAWCRDAKGEDTRVSIVDCSDGNFGISGACACTVNDTVRLAIDDVGEFLCSVVWKREDRFAVRILDDHTVQSITDLTEILASA